MHPRCQPHVRRWWIIGLLLVVGACAAPAQTGSTDGGDTAVDTSAAFTDVLMYKGGPGRTGEAVAGIDGEPGVRWTVDTGGAVDSTPVVVDGIVHIVGGDGRLHALAADEGTVLWTSRDAGLVGSPAVGGDRIIVLGDDGSITGVTRDGATAWRTAADIEPNSTPLILGDLAIAGGTGGEIQAFDIATGARVWSVATGDELPRAAAGSGSIAIIGSHDGGLYAVESTTGALHWKLETDAGHFATPAVRDQRVYAMAASDTSAELIAVDVATGKEVWRFTPPDGRGMHSPSVDATAVYISTDRHIYAVAPEDGSLRWEASGERWNTAGMAIAEGLLYAFYGGGTLYALDAATGAQRWSLFVGGNVPSGTTVTGGLVIVGTRRGEVVAVGAQQP